jgi:hypothetical protein
MQACVALAQYCGHTRPEIHSLLIYKENQLPPWIKFPLHYKRNLQYQPCDPMSTILILLILPSTAAAVINGMAAALQAFAADKAST